MAMWDFTKKDLDAAKEWAKSQDDPKLLKLAASELYSKFRATKAGQKYIDSTNKSDSIGKKLDKMKMLPKGKK